MTILFYYLVQFTDPTDNMVKFKINKNCISELDEYMRVEFFEKIRNKILFH